MYIRRLGEGTANDGKSKMLHVGGFATAEAAARVQDQVAYHVMGRRWEGGVGRKRCGGQVWGQVAWEEVWPFVLNAKESS